MDWSFLFKNFHLKSNIPHFPSLREPRIQNQYDNLKRQLQASGIQMEDYIYFLYPELYDGNVVLTENLFPYHLKPHIKHLLLWFPPTFDHFPRLDVVTYNVFSQLFPRKKIIVFENPKELKSVRGIRHLHIFM